MKKPTVQEIHVTLEKHIAVTEERWIETILRIKRIEHIIETINGVRTEKTIITDLNSRLN